MGVEEAEREELGREEGVEGVIDLTGSSQAVSTWNKDTRTLCLWEGQLF